MNSTRHTAATAVPPTPDAIVGTPAEDAGKTAGQRKKTAITMLGTLSSSIQTLMTIGRALFKAGLLTTPGAEGVSLVSGDGRAGFILGTKDGQPAEPAAIGIIFKGSGKKAIALNANGYLTSVKEHPLKGGYHTEDDPDMPAAAQLLVSEFDKFEKRVSACIENIALRS